MKSYTNSEENIYDLIHFTNEDYNGTDGFFKDLVSINQVIADDYIDIYVKYTEDTYGMKDETVDSYPEWWTELENQIKNFLIDLKEAE